MNHYTFYLYLIHHAKFSDQLKKEGPKNDKDCWASSLAKGLCSEEELLQYYSRYKNQAIQTLESLTIDQEFTEQCLEKKINLDAMIPLYQTQKKICIAVSNPFLNETTKIKKKFKKEVEKKLILPEDLMKFKGEKPTRSDNLLNKILKSAIKKGASDIHLLNSGKDLKIWIRVEGKIIDLLTLKKEEASHLKKLIKLKANLDISEQILPQDGQLNIHINNKKWEIRVSTLPTYFEEDIVLRVFRHENKIEHLHTLRFPHNITHKIKSICHMKSGLFLVTGPTGSGKTSTLYACLNECQAQDKRIIVSLEDPIECHLSNVRQSQVNSKSNYTFIRGLRSILRQDPDIIMIGEIRDSETARIALEAAYTGHLVLSTLHTSDIQSSWLRLLHFGCDPFLLSYCVRGILSQTLKPEACYLCKSRGCEHCQFKGISGRKPEAELLYMSHNDKVYEFSNIHELVNDQYVLKSKDQI